MVFSVLGNTKSRATKRFEKNSITYNKIVLKKNKFKQSIVEIQRREVTILSEEIPLYCEILYRTKGASAVYKTFRCL